MHIRTPAALAELELGQLIGLTETQARARVERAGGVLRMIVRAADGSLVISADLRPNRVTVVSDARGRVAAVVGIG